MSRSPRLSGPVIWTAAIALLAVLYMALVVPLGFGPDETQHAFRAYQLSLGQLFPQIVDCVKHPHLMSCGGGHLVPKRRAGGRLPRSLVAVFSYIYHRSHNRLGIAHRVAPNVYASLLGVVLAPARTTFGHFENTALYSPANYLPQIAAFWTARQLGEGVVATLFTVRLVGGLVWAALVTGAVAITPRWKWLFSMVVLVPTALAQGADISADSFALGVIALTSAYALRVADRDSRPSRRQIALLALLGALIALMKFPLVVLLVAFVAILWRSLGSGRRRWLRAGAIALPGIAVGLWWDLASNSYFVPYRNVVYRRRHRVYVSEHGQEHYVLTHLLQLPALLWNSATENGLFKLDQVVAQVGQMGLPDWFAIVWLVLFVALAGASSAGGAVSAGARSWIGATLVLYWLATVLALYATWSAVGASTIDGMHGRYLTLVLIVALPLVAAWAPRRVRISERATAWAAMAISAIAAGTLFAYTSSHYYGLAPWTAVTHLSNTLF